MSETVVRIEAIVNRICADGSVLTLTRQVSCATCRWAEAHGAPWWGGIVPEEEDMSTSDRRQLAFSLVCSLADLNLPEEQDPSRQCVSMDGSDYRGELWVKPDFGCVQWEGKP